VHKRSLLNLSHQKKNMTSAAVCPVSASAAALTLAVVDGDQSAMQALIFCMLLLLLLSLLHTLLQASHHN
jgi:hypothetical protein